jgi:hypothetical protein
MTRDRDMINKAIKDLVIPEFRTLGFRGALPHFRRCTGGEHQMLMLFFNKHGGSFYIEAGRISFQRVSELREYWRDAGKELKDGSLTVGHCHPNERARLGPNGFIPGEDHWFTFGPDNANEAVYSVQPESWFTSIGAQVATWVRTMLLSSFAMRPNNRLEFALARPTRKSDALLLAAQPVRWAQNQNHE